jgi:DNA-damage-inducible protein J
MKGVTSMATTNINVRVDSDLKQSAEALFADLGLTMSSAVTMFLKSAVSHDGIPFEVKRMTPNAETRAALAEYSEMKTNPGQYKRYSSFDELMDEILTDA